MGLKGTVDETARDSPFQANTDTWTHTWLQAIQNLEATWNSQLERKWVFWNVGNRLLIFWLFKYLYPIRMSLGPTSHRPVSCEWSYEQAGLFTSSSYGKEAGRHSESWFRSHDSLRPCAPASGNQRLNPHHAALRGSFHRHHTNKRLYSLTLYFVATATVTNGHKVCGLKQQKYIISQCWRLELWNQYRWPKSRCQQGMFPPEALGENLSLAPSSFSVCPISICLSLTRILMIRFRTHWDNAA